MKPQNEELMYFQLTIETIDQTTKEELEEKEKYSEWCMKNNVEEFEEEWY